MFLEMAAAAFICPDIKKLFGKTHYVQEEPHVIVAQEIVQLDGTSETSFLELMKSNLFSRMSASPGRRLLSFPQARLLTKRHMRLLPGRPPYLKLSSTTFSGLSHGK